MHSEQSLFNKRQSMAPLTVKPAMAHYRKRDNTTHLVGEHLRSVGLLAAGFAGKLNIALAGELIGLLHDIGKYSQEFQDYIQSALGLVNCDEDDYVDADAQRGKVDHSSAGAQYIWRALSERGGLESLFAQVLALCVASHHSGLIDCLDVEGEDNFSRRMNKAKDKTHLDEVCRAADTEIMARIDELLGMPELFTELRNSIGNIFAKNREPHKGKLRNAHQQIGLAVRYLFSCLIDADRIDTADFEHQRVKMFRPNGDYAKWPALITRLERKLSAMLPTRPIDHLRRDISQHCLDAATRPGGTYTLTVPTGGGKTLASLRFALHHAQQRKLDRIIYVIPFTSIIEQNAQVVRDILEPADAPEDHGKIVLEHHSSVTPEQQTWREKILCENWDAPVVYTTMVQLLEALFGAGTRGARRMHQLANTVLIFDEVQTLPIKCTHLFNNAINFLTEQCNSTVVLCTATQPLLHKVAAEKGAIRLAAQHEIMPDVHKLFADLKRVDVRDQRKPGGWSVVEVAQLALDELRRAGSSLVIVNTKRAAQAVFELCHTQLEQGQAFHLSTDMCPAHRKDELANVRARLAEGLPTLCVSTQLIEAGVDVDFGVVIRYLAGLDSIAQAAGRCNRNGRPEPGIVHIVNPRPEDEKLTWLPDIAKGRDVALRLLDDYAVVPARYADNLFGPVALSDFYQYYFFERQKEMDYSVSASALGRDDTIANLLAENSGADADCRRKYGKTPERMLNQSFMAAAKAFKAIDAPTQGVVVPYGPEGTDIIAKLHASFDVELDVPLLRRAQQFTVNVFPNVFEQLVKVGAVHSADPNKQARILTLDPRYYSPQFGISTEPVSTMEALYVD
ncbi:CRISPR-associated helicase Cas3' [Aeromonas sp. MdU4]|uniref:CRISPR-associated helicase Cas3' n=1 Tax=Aeromonas sp. MdU4 TaxID=3342819 RepID=UPI0035B7B6C0